MRHIIAPITCVLLLLSSDASSRAGTVAESRLGYALSFTTYVGQSFTTGPAAEYAGISFNLYRTKGNPSTNPYADPDYTYYLLSKEFLGRYDQLSDTTSGFIAKTTGVRGDQYVFDPSVTLLGNTQYWLYGSSDVPSSSLPVTQIATGVGYSGGQFYWTDTHFRADDRYDLAFTINSRPKSLLDLLYGAPNVDTGPLSLGLHELPAEPVATFTFAEGTPLAGGSTGYRLEDVLSAELIFGDIIGPNNVIGPNNLTGFYMEVNADGSVDALSYTFAAIDTPTAEGVIAMNSFIGLNGYIGMDGIIVQELPFSVTGTDILSGEAFAYTYASAEPTRTVPPDPTRSLLDVIYDTPVINSGPLSFGLAELPAAPQPTFALSDGTPLEGGGTGYGLSDVVSANLDFGDGHFKNLTAFNMEVDGNGLVTALSYTFAAIDTLTAEHIIILNFPLTITGTDIASGEAFAYTYANSTPTRTVLPQPPALKLSGVGLSGGTFTFNVENIPSGQTYHLRQSTDLLNFVPVSPPVDITDTTPQPLAVTVDTETQPKLFIGVSEGASPTPE